MRGRKISILGAGLAGTALLICGILAGCQAANNRAVETTSKNEENANAGETSIRGDGDSIQIQGSGAKLDGRVVTISSPGTYRLSGTVKDGRILVDAGKEDEVRLILDGFTIESSDFSAIYGSQCGQMTIFLEEGTENAVKDGKAYVYPAAGEDEPDAAIFCKDDMVFEGGGSLSVWGNYQNGIRGKDDVTVESGTYVIQAVNDGIKGKDSVEVNNGNLTITAGGDGIQSSNDAEEDKGYVRISEGSFEISAGKKGISAETMVEIQGGAVTIDSEDDAIHSNGDVDITSGILTLSTGDDAVHGDGQVTVSGGEVMVAKSYEGLEGLAVTISGGEISIISEDDGINAAGGTDLSGNTGKGGDRPFAATEGTYIRITGGNVKVDASGDGIDSNGDLFMEGGTVIVEGAPGMGDGALDYDGSGIISGGTILAAGSSGMFRAFSEDSAQPMLLLYYEESQEAGVSVTVTDSDRSSLYTTTSSKPFEALLFSSPELEQGKTYRITTGESAVEFTVQGILNQSGAPAGRGGFGGGPGRGKGQGMEAPGNPPDDENAKSINGTGKNRPQREGNPPEQGELPEKKHDKSLEESGEATAAAGS